MRAGRLRLLPHPAGVNPDAAPTAQREERRAAWPAGGNPALEERQEPAGGPGLIPAPRLRRRRRRKSTKHQPSTLPTKANHQPYAPGLIFN